MARVSPIQESFAGGEIGQRVRGRVSSEIYEKGLASAVNWWPLVQGPIRLRTGFQYITPVDADNWVSGQAGVQGLRIFTFQRGLDEDVIIEVGPDTIIARNSMDGGGVIGGVTGNLVTDPGFLTILATHPVFPHLPANSPEWQPDLDKYLFGTDPGRSHSGDCVTENGFILGGACPPQLPACVFGMNGAINTNNSPSGFHGPALENSAAAPIIIPAGSELELNEFSFIYLQFIGFRPNDHDNLLPFPWDNPVIRVAIGTTKGGNDIFTSDISITDGIHHEISFNFIPGAGNNTLYFSIGEVWPGPAAVPDITTDIACLAENTMVFRIVNPVWVAPLAGGSGSSVEFVSPYTSAQLECLQVCMDPGEQVMFFTHPEVETHRLKLENGEWLFEALSAILLPEPFQGPVPNNWTAGNFPAACAFHEGRLWLGGSPSDPATLWASASGDYVNFDASAAADKADPLLFPLSSTGNIQTLTSRKELVILTDISEVIGTSQQGVIAFDDFSFPKQTDWGSNCVQPIEVGRDMIYTSNSRKRLRTFADEGGTNFGWDGQELSLIAQDIFNVPVRRMIYLDEPAYQACFLLADGSMGMATYFYPEEVIGWWRFRTAHNGDREFGDTTKPGLGNQFDNATQSENQIIDITKVNTSQGAKLWAVVNRVGYPGTQLPGHELLSFDDPLLPPIAMDSFVSRIIDPVTKTISDIDHLTDQSINCVIERPSATGPTYTVHPNITAIAGVSSPLEDWAAQLGNNAIVGLFYSNNWQLLPVKGVSNRGTSQVSKRRWNKIHLRLNNSAVPLVNGEPPKDRTPVSPMGEGEPFVTEDKEYSELGTDQGELFITQDKPLQSEVLALFGKLISEEV